MNQNTQNTCGRNGTRRKIAKTMLMIGGGLLATLSLAAPVLGQAVPTTLPTHSAPSGRSYLITDGLSKDGKVALVANKTTVVTTARPYKSVSVGQPEVADVTPVSPTNILITAKKPGTTQLVIWDDNNRSQVADVNVTMDLEALASQLNSMFPGTAIEVSGLSGSIALRGRVPDIQTAEQATSAAGAYGVKVLNFLEVGGGQQVMLQVRFAEVSRNATSQLGVNFAMTDGIFSLGSNVGQVTPSGFAEGSPGSLATQQVGSGVTLFGSGQAGAVAFRYFISALRQNNLLRMLAEPNLIAMSGQEASFLAGGEFPVPVPQSGNGGAATITIEYREFGVRLGFVPVVLGDGRIRLKMTPEVSDLDFSTPIVISGSRIPVVNKRRVTTMVELADGQTFAIAGLLNNNIAAAKDVTPVLGDLPILGTLFRSVRYQRKETELVVLVTPKLVAPLNPGQVHKLPGENWRHPNEAQLFLNQDLGGEQEIPVERASDADDSVSSASGGLAPAAASPTTAPSNTAVAMAPNATTQPANQAATTQPALASTATTKPALAAAPVTQPAIASTATTKPAMAITPATQPTNGVAVAATPTTKPAMAMTPATQPTNVIAVAPATKPALVMAPATQPTVAPAVASVTTKPVNATSVAAANTTQPSNTIASNPTNTTQPVKSVAMATPALPTPKSTGNTPIASDMRFTPRYHGRHGFTPPSHAPPRGQQ